MRRSIVMRQIACVSIIVIGIAGAATALDPVRMAHPRGWAVTAPANWDPFQGDQALGADFRIFAPREIDAACAFYSRSGLGLGMTNDEIKSALAASALYDTAVVEFLQSDPLFPGELSDIVVKEVRSQPNHPSGWPFQRAAFTYFDGGTEARGGKSSQGWAVITFKNDTVFVGYCGANDASVADAKPAFSVILNTIEMTR